MNIKTKNEDLSRLKVEEFHAATKSPLTLILDDIRSLNNIGSIFRTADAFRIKEIVLCGITAQPPHRDIHKTALGATESVSWRYEEDVLTAVKELQDNDVKMLALEQTEKAISLEQFVPEKNVNYAIVLGNEVRGVDQKVVDMADHCIEIPQFGTKHSFNVSVSNGIILWDLVSKLNLCNSL